MKLSLLAKFLLTSIAALICLMPLWYYLSPLFAGPVFYLAGEPSYAIFSWVIGHERRETTGVLLTNLTVYSPINGQFKAGKLAPMVDYRILGYGIVMYWALMVASRPRNWGIKLLLGSAAMLPIQALAVCFQWFNDVFNRAGPEVFAQTHLPNWIADVAAFGYHFHLFIFTALAPVLMWVVLNHAFLLTLWAEIAKPSTPPTAPAQPVAPAQEPASH